MNDQSLRVVKIRVRMNVSGKRVIGYVDLPQSYDRTSDLLNGPDMFILVRPEKQSSENKGESSQIIQKGAISYLEALEEPKHAETALQQGRFQPVAAEFKEPTVLIKAEIFVPQGSSVLSVLNDERGFINLCKVRFESSVEQYSYIAVGKKQIILMKTQ
ncbi:MAG: hypothetical protein AABY87_10000 [bacterium]